MSYTNVVFVFGEQPTASKWNALGVNDAGFKDGSLIDDDAILAKHTEELPKSVNRQNINTAGNAVVSDILYQWGWSFVTGTGSSKRKVTTIVFPVEYDATPVVLATVLGYKNSNPSNIDDFVTIGGNLGDLSIVPYVNDITVTTCKIELVKPAANFQNGARIGFSWLAIGTVAR